MGSSGKKKAEFNDNKSGKWKEPVMLDNPIRHLLAAMNCQRPGLLKLLLVTISDSYWSEDNNRDLMKLANELFMYVIHC